jgi:hypothetical protein
VDQPDRGRTGYQPLRRDTEATQQLGVVASRRRTLPGAEKMHLLKKTTIKTEAIT